MLSKQVESVMKSSLVKFSKQLNIPLKEFRIKMKLDESLEQPICIAMHKSNTIKNLDWNSILGLKSIFKDSIVSVIRDRLHTLSDANNIEKKNISVKFTAKDTNGTPIIYLCDGAKTIKDIEIKDFI